MKRVALVFVIAVFVPSLVLAWLAVRSLRDQQFLLERQQSLLYQGVTDSIAKSINDAFNEKQAEFNGKVEEILTDKDPRSVAADFDNRIRREWSLAEVGFCVTLSGNLLCPSLPNRPDARQFNMDNGGFLANKEVAEVYWNDNLKGGNPSNALRNTGQVIASSPTAQNQKDVMVQQPADSYGNNYNSKQQNRKVEPVQQALQLRDVAIEQVQQQNISKVVSTETEFRQVIGDARDGMIARFLQNKLKLMFWHRLKSDPKYVFGAQLDLAKFLEGLQEQEIVQPEPALSDEICVALLDDNANPRLLSQAKVDVNWKRPFVATEVGEVLPHWEVGVYLLRPERLTQAADTAKLTLGLLILVLVLAIGIGSWLIVSDVKGQLLLTRQKTDFVSNVSHELKTPLTSIRMFSELLVEGKVTDPAKQKSYYQIISAESARLTRLINNVLDFARMERGEKKYNFQPHDLSEVLKDTVATYRPHLESEGFKLDFTPPASSIRISGDRDAISQVIVNLLSNAEKYSNGAKEIAVEVQRFDAPVKHVEVSVMDRGVGVPKDCEEKIFEQFYRAHDSLGSGIQGSGLGLTLARQIARAHGGDVVCEPREGGGSRFILRLPSND